ncbi:MAG: cysteine--tRNA ligase [Myxococcota bacterium]
MTVPPLRLYNTQSRKIETVQPIEPGTLRLYVCGMTVYDHCHVGHARAMLVYDALVRYLRYRGWDVRFARNITDIDDKILAKAAAEGTDVQTIADRYIQSFHDDMAALGNVEPDFEPRVSQTLDEIRGMIGALIERGHAYAADGTVWFDVRSYEAYGKLSGQKVDELRSEDPEGGKRFGADFALWKAARPGDVSWPSPWGAGRPGWHIECSAMAEAALGNTIDIHGGGLDLVFPHHENEIAQSECAHGSTFVNLWMHNGMLTVDTGTKAGGRADRAAREASDEDAEQVDTKMGKSKGNAFVIRNALQLVPAETIRLYYLQTHYRSPLPWNDDALMESLSMLARLYEAREQAEGWRGEEKPDDVARSIGSDAMTVLSLGRAFEEALHNSLDHDFNTAKALGLAFELARAINRLGNHKKVAKRAGPIVAPALKAFGTLSEALGLLSMSSAEFQAEVRVKRLAAMGVPESAVQALLDQRLQARADKDWTRADALRDELDGMGIVVMDTADGLSWKVKL